MTHLHFYAAALLTCASSLLNILIVSVFASPSTAKAVKRQYLLYAAALSWWSLCVFIFSSVPDKKLSYLWLQLLHLGAIFIPVFWFHFNCVFFKLKGRFCFVELVAYYCIALAFLFVNFFLPSLFIADVLPKERFPYFMVAGPLYIYWIVLFVVISISAHVKLFRFYLHAKGLKRKQLQLFFFASFIGYLGAAGYFLPVYDRFYFPYPYGCYGAAVYGIAAAIAILKYGLLDIEVIIKKTLVFAGIVAAAVSVIALPFSLIQAVIGRAIGIPPFWLLVSGIATAVLIFRPLEGLLTNLTDHFLFQKKESFKVVLNRLSEAIITILDLDQVGKKILETLRESLRLESGAILLRDEEEQGFYILDSYQIQRKEPKYGKDDFLFYYLAKYGGMVNLEDEGAKNRLPAMLLGRLEELNARLCIPLFLHQDLNGVLTLGKKKSDEEFTQEELDYLPAVAGQVAIALSNARLVEIVKKSQIDFAQQAKMAAIGTLAAGIGHEIKNPLQIIKSGIGMLKFNKDHGVYNPLTKEQFEAEVFEVIDKIRAAIERAVAVIDRLSGFARKPKELKLEEIHVEHAVEGALDFVRNEFENFQIAVKKNYASDLSPILVDSHAVEEVLLNILVNARHAIQERGTVTLTTRSHGPEVEVAVQDTGPGIAPESLDKIFDPFFTTKDTTRNSDPSTIKGTGLGLFIVRETVKKFGGRIAVESETGKGTTFHIYFPAAEGSGAQDRILRSPLPREAEGEGLGEGA